MTKKEFLSGLKRKLIRLNRSDLRERLGFYSEIIDDKIEEGLSEEEAVADVGSIDEIAEQILSDSEFQGSHVRKRAPISPWEIALLIIGSPIWLSILIAVFAVLLSVNVTLWAVEIPLYVIGFISKYLSVACVWFSKFSVKLTKKCADCVSSIFGA